MNIADYFSSNTANVRASKTNIADYFKSNTQTPMNVADFFKPNIEQEVNPIQNQIDNASFRLQQGAGIAPEDIDTRNWFEKATNLPENQNFLFDFLELINRPAQAVTNVVHTATNLGDSRSVGRAAWEGLSGQREIHGRDLLSGMDDGLTKSALGFGLDVALDPVTYTPAGVFRAAGRGIQSGAKAVENLLPAQVRQGRETLQDSLGNIFNRDYGLDRTLSGGRSDDVINLQRGKLDAQRYYTDEALDDTMRAVQTAGGLDQGLDVGRVMEGVTREAPENIQRASQMLDESLARTRQFASENGFDLNQIEEYMPHILSKEAREHMSKNTNPSGFRFQGGDLREMNPRTLRMPVEEANARIRAEKGIDFDWFEPNAFIATAEKQRRLVNAITAESFKRQVLNNPDFAYAIPKGQRIPLSKDQAIISPEKYRFFNAGVAEDGTDILKGFFTRDQDYVVPKAVKRALDNFNEKLTDEGVNAFIGALDKVQDTWKKFALFSGGFHVRNFIGNNFNMWIAGMNPPQIQRYLGESTAEIFGNKNSPTYDAFKRQGLREGTVFETEFRFGNQQDSLAQAIENRSRNLASRAIRRPFQASRDLGVSVDEVNRYALFKWALDNPNKAFDGDTLAKIGQGSITKERAAADKVREVLFDYSDLSNTERQYFRRMMPFYTWLRKNSVYQITNILTQPKYYATTEKARQASLDYFGIEDEKLPEWLKESFAFPVAGDGEGSGAMLGMNLPVADLASMTDPMRMFTDSLTPLIKTPLELGTNTNLFTGRPIQEFHGQTDSLGGLNMDSRLAHLVRQLGAVRNLAGHIGRADEGDYFNIITGNMLKPHDVEQADYFTMLRELQQLQDEMRRYEQNVGQKVPTIAELREMGIVR